MSVFCQNIGFITRFLEQILYLLIKNRQKKFLENLIIQLKDNIYEFKNEV